MFSTNVLLFQSILCTIHVSYQSAQCASHVIHTKNHWNISPSLNQTNRAMVRFVSWRFPCFELFVAFNIASTIIPPVGFVGPGDIHRRVGWFDELYLLGFDTLLLIINDARDYTRGLIMYLKYLYTVKNVKNRVI